MRPEPGAPLRLMPCCRPKDTPGAGCSPRHRSEKHGDTMERTEQIGASPAAATSSFVLGAAIPGPDGEIELDRVERELASLWAAAAPDEPGAEAAVLRACALNLLVL